MALTQAYRERSAKRKPCSEAAAAVAKWLIKTHFDISRPELQWSNIEQYRLHKGEGLMALRKPTAVYVH